MKKSSRNLFPDSWVMFKRCLIISLRNPETLLTATLIPFFLILLFGTIFIYMVISMFMYLTEKHVTAYEVKKGTITGNYRFQSFALREEEVITAGQSGSIRYYEREGSKTSAGSVVCSINETGSMEPAAIDDFSLGKEDESRLRDTMSSFTINYSGNAFQKVYDLKSSIEGTISEIIEESS